jgi:hypothetical protein
MGTAHRRKSANKSGLRRKNFCPDFVLTRRRGGNKIQLQSFGGCDSVETDSPIEHHPGRTGERMLTLRGEHFYFQANTQVILECCPPHASLKAFSPLQAQDPIWKFN